jgi:hypothetical protein
MSARMMRILHAARDFLRGFLGMPSPRLRDGGSGACVRHALEDRSARRKSCC